MVTLQCLAAWFIGWSITAVIDAFLIPATTPSWAIPEAD